LFIALDLTFFSAAMHKVFEGGWFPLAMGASMFAIMMVWNQGRTRLRARLQSSSVPIDELSGDALQRQASSGPRHCGFSQFNA
jgi:KUP system potassium uptake protein